MIWLRPEEMHVPKCMTDGPDKIGPPGAPFFASSPTRRRSRRRWRTRDRVRNTTQKWDLFAEKSHRIVRVHKTAKALNNRIGRIKRALRPAAGRAPPRGAVAWAQAAP